MMYQAMTQSNPANWTECWRLRARGREGPDGLNYWSIRRMHYALPGPERGVYAASTSLLHTASHYFETVPYRAMKRPKGRAPTFRPSRVVVYPAASSITYAAAITGGLEHSAPAIPW